MFSQIPSYFYIHWPFCSKKCHYCDFVAFEQHESYQDAYHQALLAEIDAFFLNRKDCPGSLKTLFIGGGTPSLYPLNLIQELFDKLKSYQAFDKLAEITIETNPADIDEEKLEFWRELGINRISIGVQSLNDNVLLKLNRRQRNKDVYNAIKIIPKYFQNISIDLILGLPEVTDIEWIDTIQKVSQWPLHHISVYFLTVHEKTPLYFDILKKKVSLADDETLVRLYETTIKTLEQAGFEQYEISNFAKAEYSSIHNQAYWNRIPYKGFGVGSSSFDGSYRSITINNLDQYLKKSMQSPLCLDQTVEKLTPKQHSLELLMLGLRQKRGINLHDVVQWLSPVEKNIFEQTLPSFIQAGFIEQYEDIIRLTTMGMALENEIVTRLF